ncbi:MAG: terpene cyclase/mutase family protein [Verrucomicrobiales bacterium]|nr:terpene cyclase/mutase family protein [Verrucomicrobiales bacterium]
MCRLPAPAGLATRGVRFLARSLAVLGFLLGGLESGQAASATPAPVTAPKVSRAELTRAIDRGVQWLLTHQNSNGWWSTADQPAVTALVLTALNREPSGRFLRERPSELSRAYDFLLMSARPDGSIHRGGLANYNTALSLVALSTAGDPNFLPVIRGARAYLAGTQVDFGTAGTHDTPYDGGVGYGSKYQHSDMNNTLMAIEAMRWSESALPRDEIANAPKTAKDLNWAAVAAFLQNCQNLPSHNPAPWVSTNDRDHGGFVYYPGHSMAGGETNAVTGRVALRSYGSISYAGLLSYVYARVEKDDPRVTAVLEWLRENYTLEENPGMGQQGYYYYLHLMTKALTAARVGTLKARLPQAGGAGPHEADIDWRQEVARRLLTLQSPDGSWVNENQRWWETDRSLVTAYVLITLEMLHAAGA